jgi:hypothetical protein
MRRSSRALRRLSTAPARDPRRDYRTGRERLSIRAIAGASARDYRRWSRIPGTTCCVGTLLACPRCSCREERWWLSGFRPSSRPSGACSPSATGTSCIGRPSATMRGRRHCGCTADQEAEAILATDGFSTWPGSGRCCSISEAAVVHVQDDVDVVPGPLVGAGQLGDVPAPHLIGGGGDELGLDDGGVAGLTARLTDLGAGPQQPIHRRD